MSNAFEGKEYCLLAFLDITQAFDKVGYDGLTYMDNYHHTFLVDNSGVSAMNLLGFLQHKEACSGQSWIYFIGPTYFSTDIDMNL